MKKLITISLFAALLATGTALKAQQEPNEYLGLPGDNLNLYAVMQLFQDSKTLEDFERELNNPESNINNLDLNDDNMVDYLTVVDNVDNNVHNIVIQDQLGPKEVQDVAVFTVQRFNDGQVQIQLTGDEALYGKNYIIEPIFDSNGTPNPGYTGNATVVNGRTVTVVTTTPVQIAAWPLIRFIYSPRYVVWHSSWYWGYYPRWWHPWKPFYWDYYYGYHHNLYNHYYRHYRRWDTHRYSHWNDFYHSTHYRYSPSVHKRIESGAYRKTYSHPGQRKIGEEAYRKNYNPHNGRTSVSTNTNRTTRRVENNNTHQGKPAVSKNRTTVTRRTSTGVTNSNTRKNYSNSNSNRDNNARTERKVTPQKNVNRTTVTRKTTTTQVKSNGSRSASRRSAGISNSHSKSNQSKASKPAKASKSSKKTSSASKKSEKSKAPRRK